MTHVREGEMKMEKKSFFGSSMKTYYFKLRGQTLVYSKSSSSPIEGNFRIDHSSVKEWSKYPNGITLKTTNGETINLCTTSAFQFKRWIKALGTFTKNYIYGNVAGKNRTSNDTQVHQMTALKLPRQRKKLKRKDFDKKR